MRLPATHLDVFHAFLEGMFGTPPMSHAEQPNRLGEYSRTMANGSLVIVREPEGVRGASMLDVWFQSHKQEEEVEKLFHAFCKEASDEIDG